MDSPKKPSPQGSPAASAASSSSSAVAAATDKATIKVYLPNGGFNIVRYGDAIDVKGIITTVTARLSTGERYYRGVYAMRLCRPATGESYWLHQDTTMAKVQEKYLKGHPLSEWRFELKMRYFPGSIQDLYERDKVTFFFFFDQVPERGCVV